MKSLFETIKERQENKSKANSERATLLEEFVIEINKERIASNYKPLITGKAVAMKVGHLKNIQDLYTFLSLARDYKNRKGSFGKYFFGSLKTK